MNKALITGSTSKVGKFILETYRDRFDWVFADHKDYDLNLSEDCERVVELSKDVDIFFNIAHVGTGQGDLAHHIFNIWLEQKNNKHKKIISIGSLVTEATNDFIIREHGDRYDRITERRNYIAEKLYLEKIHKELTDVHLDLYKEKFKVPHHTLLRFVSLFEPMEEYPNDFYTPTAHLKDVFDFILNYEGYISTMDVRWV